MATGGGSFERTERVVDEGDLEEKKIDDLEEKDREFSF
jgi:hypothetical protein